MAGGKETPRQKMIGLMYLVLTAMLALNVSKQILQGYLSVNDSLNKSKVNIEENNKRVNEAFKNSIDVNRAAEPYYLESNKSLKDIEEVYKYVDDVKGNMIRAVLGLDESVKVLGDTVNLRNKPANDKIDDYDVPTTVLLGPNWEEGLKEGPLTAKDLSDKLTALHDKLIQQVERMAKDEKTFILPDELANLKKKIAIVKPTDSGREEDGIKFTWPLDNFYHLPMAAVFVNLNKMQVDLKNVEAEILQVFSAASGKVAIKFDQIKARVLASSSYIQQGGTYEADIFLGASSSSIKPEDMEVIIGVDSAEAVSGKTGQKVEVVNGEGKYKLTATAVGDQKYRGVIKYKNPKGVFEYYPFAKEYKVAPASAAVAPDYMNVFYAGVVNPVTAQAAGVAPADLVISANGAGARVVQKSPGKYDFTFTGTGECLVTVSAKTPEGVKAQGPAFKFKVKPLPKPDLKIGGKFSPTEMKKDELATVRALGAGAVGFDFQANYKVVNWEISGTNNKGKYFPGITGSGPTIGQEALNLLSAPQVGSKVYFECKIQGPDGKVNSVLQSVKVLK
jgi:gliding motility-associated protein GldM